MVSCFANCLLYLGHSVSGAYWTMRLERWTGPFQVQNQNQSSLNIKPVRLLFVPGADIKSLTRGKTVGNFHLGKATLSCVSCKTKKRVFAFWGYILKYSWMKWYNCFKIRQEMGVLMEVEMKQDWQWVDNYWSWGSGYQGLRYTHCLLLYVLNVPW